MKRQATSEAASRTHLANLGKLIAQLTQETENETILWFIGHEGWHAFAKRDGLVIRLALRRPSYIKWLDGGEPLDERNDPEFQQIGSSKYALKSLSVTLGSTSAVMGVMDRGEYTLFHVVDEGEGANRHVRLSYNGIKKSISLDTMSVHDLFRPLLAAVFAAGIPATKLSQQLLSGSIPSGAG